VASRLGDDIQHRAGLSNVPGIVASARISHGSCKIQQSRTALSSNLNWRLKNVCQRSRARSWRCCCTRRERSWRCSGSYAEWNGRACVRDRLLEETRRKCWEHNASHPEHRTCTISDFHPPKVEIRQMFNLASRADRGGAAFCSGSAVFVTVHVKTQLGG
jgi:hypothetical protein